uniref:Uncharacterized protein n=1 Tax=Anguilla anguilla TaxID=7936 RepID=A0A0E9SD63_ANGAN
MLAMEKSHFLPLRRRTKKTSR